MTDRTASAYFSSAVLHASVIALICLLACSLNPPEDESPKIFELVAGTGDNYAATEAPALGSPTGVKVDLPAPLPPPPAPPAEPVAEPVPLQAADAVPVPAAQPVKPKPAAKPKPTPNFLRTVQRTVSRVEKRIEDRQRRREEAERKRLEAEQRRQMTEAEFRKEHPEAGRGIAGGVVGGSIANTTGGAGGKALTRTQGSELDAYWSLLESRVKENFVQPASASDALVAKVSFYLDRDGSISSVRIVRSSGNADFDESVLAAFARTHPILPPSFFHGDTVELEFSMHEDASAG